MEGFSKDGRKLRPRKTAEGSAHSEKVDYQTSGPREGRSFNGERRSYGNGEHRSFNGERRNFSGDRRPRQFGERSNDGERHSFSGERKSFGDGEHRSFNGERRNFSGDRRPRQYGEHSNDGERHSFSGERRSFGDGEHRSFNGERRNFSGDRKPRQYGEHSNGGERHSFSGERRSFGDGEHRSFNGEHRSFGNGEHRSFSGDRKPRQFGNRKPGFGGRKPYGNRETYFNRDSEEGINRMISRRPQVDDESYEGGEFTPEEIKNEVRLNKFIANSGVCSRREADTLIQAGVVTVNGEVVTELGMKINIFDDDVRFNGERLKGEEKVYLVMNKPKGYVTTASDPHAEKTVMDLLTGCTTRVYPVGRLDKATTGVLMFTNDGEIAERLTHPSYDKKKIYQVALDRELTKEDYDKILEGVELSDGMEKADTLEYIDENDHRKLGIEIHSGKNRVVRRIFESIGYNVKALDRVYFAGLTKKGLKKGEWRYLSESEVNILKMGAYV